ncbi:MAG: porin family protein [bacterium]|nr:porin family protein [bacterium]
MNWIITSVVLVAAALSVQALAIGFGGYYTMSLPSETYHSSELDIIDFEISYVGFSGKVWYDISRNLAVEAAAGYSEYPTEPLTLPADDPGAFVPENLTLLSGRLGARFGLPIAFLTPYASVGAGFYHVSVAERRLDGLEDNFSKCYPGVYVGVGAKVRLYGPVSLDVSPTYSYVFGTGGEGDRIERLSTFDLNVGMAIDM